MFEQSANGLILGEQSPNNLNGGYRFLFATNAGSNTISVFRVKPDGLELVDQQPSGGTHPISVTFRKSVLYVLNGGSVQCTGGGENITGFKVSSGGNLTPIPGSTRPLSGQSTGCAQVSFNPSGTVLAVTERNADIIATYTVDNNGIATGPTPNDNSESGGSGPFGFTFTQRDQLLVAESAGGTPTQGGLASFNVDKKTGTLEVAGPNTRNGQSDTCWGVNTDNGKFAFVTSFQSGNISSYRVDPDGSLTLLNPNAGNTGGAGASDQTLSGDSRFLYSRNSVQGTISSFRVENDGTLVPLQVVAAPDAGGAGIGIAAK
ncbi:MAG: lactonase family protein [Rubrobacteraceae bacterium]